MVDVLARGFVMATTVATGVAVASILSAAVPAVTMVPVAIAAVVVVVVSVVSCIAGCTGCALNSTATLSAMDFGAHATKNYVGAPLCVCDELLTWAGRRTAPPVCLHRGVPWAVLRATLRASLRARGRAAGSATTTWIGRVAVLPRRLQWFRLL